MVDKGGEVEKLPFRRLPGSVSGEVSQEKGVSVAMLSQEDRNREERGKYSNWQAEGEQNYRNGKGQAFRGKLDRQFDWTVSIGVAVERDAAEKYSEDLNGMSHHYC